MRILREPTRVRSLRELLYGLIAFPIALTLAIVFFIAFAVSVSLTITVVGIPLLAVVVLLGRYQGTFDRAIGRTLLGADLEGPRPFRPRPGAFGWLGSALGHADGWRGLAYLVVRLPVTFVASLTAWTLWGVGLMFLSYPTWWYVAATDVDPDAGVTLGQNHMDSWYEIAWITAIGLAMVLVAPWAVRLVAKADIWLMRVLLGPTRVSERVRDLEETRALAVDDSAARLRRIERDLHDGAQARIVALAMHLSQAQERLDEDEGTPDLTKARAHVDSALGNARLAITELRDLARGIHPPVLDEGLDVAFATLIAGSAVPVRMHADIPVRPPAAVESIAYFCAAELLTNVARHSDATAVQLDVVRTGDTLVVTVQDNGSGGARVRPGGGLAGLAERVRTVDGSVRIESPEHGPTRVTVELPAA
ncbi:sensor domain-containing protein [Yinghuangia sp. KLBMP8922]|uniref:histidine kinase n=1 Tax=Yinghuangia soli TaxID=2908204 RepID=A0AA41Q8L0_9ACTN|nr:sensor domain-containing protein [Yinghuangia soli]